MTPIHTEVLPGGLTFNAYPDADIERPFDGDEDIKIVVLHRRYLNPAQGELDTVEEVEAFEARAEEDGWFVLPLWLYDHGAVSYGAAESNPFGCPWDSGRVGIIAIRREAYGYALDADYHTLSASIASAYTSWANGDALGYVVTDAEGQERASCWGFYDLDDARQSALESIQ